MKVHVGSCLSLVVLSAVIDVIRANENETDTREARRGRVNGRIVKLYSGSKPDPVLCLEEGFKADPTDCSIFYRCVQSFSGKYNVFRFQCGPGTVYDPDTEVCNHPSSTKRSECSGAIVPARHEVDDNDIDFGELPSPISTMSPLYVNKRKNDSGAFTLSTANIRDKYTVGRDGTTSLNLFTTTTAKQQFSEAFDNLGTYWNNKYTTSSQVPSVSTEPSRSDRSDPCTSDGFVGDSYDCKKFYRCVSNFRGSFIRYEFVCGESTVWDDDKQSCNYAWDVRSTRCGRDASDDNRLLTSNDLEQKKPTFTSNYNDATTRYQNEHIATDNTADLHFGEKLNNYYTSRTSENPISNNIEINKPQITNNYNDVTAQYLNENVVTDNYPVAVNFTTNPYNIYNPPPIENQINYGITESQIKVNEIREDFTTTQTTSTPHTPSSSSKRNDLHKLVNICHQSGFIGDPNDCQKFYRCVDTGQGTFTRYDFSCSQGTVWDSSIEACNHAWAVAECGSKLSAQSLTTETSILNPSSSMNIDESQDDTDEDDSDYGYLNQIHQENIRLTTPKTETTVSLATTFEDPKNVDKPCSSSGFFKNSVDCKKFYKCIENGRGSFTRFDYNCGEGTSWDETIEACNHDWAVTSCKTNSDRYNDTGIMTTVTLVQTTTQKNINNNDYDSMYGIEHSMPTPDTFMDLSSSTTSKEIPNSYNRKCNKDGFMGDKEDCKKFYRCVDIGQNDYIRYEFSCGDGTVWDSAIEACNYDQEVEDCRSTSSNNIDENNLENIDSTENVDSGYVTPSEKDPDSSIQTTLLYTTTSISEIDNNNNICKSLGFIGDTEHCEKFYRCVDNGKGGFSRIEFSCGEGTVWDSSIEACNHRWAVEKCGKNSDSEISETTSYPVSTITNDMSDSTTKQQEGPHTSTQPTLDQETHSDNKCTSEGFFGSESEDCKKFYRCVDNGKGGYTKYEFYCGDGTVWDESILACNHATSNTTCGRGTPSSSSKPAPDPTSTISTSSTESNTPTSTENIDASSHDNICTSEGFMADSSDCRKFFRCVDNGKGGFTKFDFSCGEGTVWIQEIQACDHETDDTTCNISKSTTVKISTTVAEDLTTSSTHSSPDNVVTDLISSTTEINYSNKNDSDKCSSDGFYANKYDCKRFYRCVDDGKGSYTKYEFTCAEGTAWDVQSQSCNYIAEVNSCQNNKIPQTETKPDSVDNAGPETQENMTTTPIISTTTSTRPNQNTCQEEGFFGDNADCKKFYRCVSNEKDGFTKYDFTCGEGTIWDQDITACNHPDDVSNPSCRSDASSKPISSTSSTVDVSNNTDYTSAPITTSSPSTTSTSDSTTTAKDTNSNCSNTNKDNVNNNNYTCTKAGFYADPNDCKKFYRCVDWENNGEKFSIYHFDCGDGTIWDPALETCNHEESVYPPRNCNGSQQQNHNNSESSSTTSTPSETESTSTYETTTTSLQPSGTKATTTTTQKSTTETSTRTPSTTQSAPTTTTKKSTTQSKPSSTTTTTTTTTQRSTTTTTTTREPSTQQTSTTSSEESTTEQSTQSTTDVTIASTTDQTTTNKEPTNSEATTSNSYESTATTTQMPSTTEQSTATTEVSTSTEEISPQTTDSQSSTTESSTTSTTDSTTEANSSSNKDCPETEDDQYVYVCPTSFKRHPKYCNMFYQCTDDNDNHDLKIAVFNCPNNTIYDESKTQCVQEEKANKKCNGQISQRSRIKRLGLGFHEPFIVSKDSMACSSVGHFPFERNEKCSPALLKCEYSKSGKLQGHVYKCPEGFVYWTVSRRCEALRKVKDCRRSAFPWDTRHDIPVERRNISH